MQLKAGVALAALTCVLAPFAYMRMFTGFHAYDDEGIFLVALRDYLSGHPLMTPYVPLYGPFYFEVYGAIFKLLGIVPTHDSGRWITLVVWLVCSVGGGLIALRLTRSLWLGLAGQIVTFIGLIALANEPTSTYGLSTMLLLGLTGAATLHSAHSRANAALIGAIIAALCLIKVNVGAFAALGVALAWSASLGPRKRRLLAPALAVITIVFPVILMSSLLRDTWVFELAIVVVTSMLSVAVTILVSSQPWPTSPSVRWLVAGAVALAVVCLGVAVAGGSRPSQIVDFLFVFPLRFPQVFTLPIGVNPAVAGWAVLMLGVALASLRIGFEVPPTARVACGLFTWGAILLLPSSVFLLSLPLAWLAARGPRDDGGVDAYTRSLLPALGVLEAMQAYPVAGTQVSLAALGMMPIGAILIRDGLRERGRRIAWPAPTAFAASAAMAALLVVVFVLNFQSSTPLGLPGAESVHLSAQQKGDLTGIVGAVSDHRCSYLLTLPGMDSFYVWTSDGSPLEMRYGQWYLTIDLAEQTAIVERLTNRPDVCVIENQGLLDFWTHGRAAPSGPLIDFIRTDFVGAGTYGDYELLVRANS